MAANDDLIEKIRQLQSQINSNLEPTYLQAKNSVEALQKELQQLASLKKFQGLSGVQASRYQALTDTLIPGATKIQQIFSSWMDEQGTNELNLDDYRTRFERDLKNMAPGVAETYAGKEFGSQEWADYASSLRRVPADQIPRAKSIHAQLRSYVRDNPSITPSEFEVEQRRLQVGQLYDAESDPRSIEALAAMRRNPVQRFFNRDNVRQHWSQGAGQAIGYSVLDLAQGAAAYSEVGLTGQRYTAEAHQRAWYGLAPGTGAVVGGAIGMMTPLGPWGGAAIGGGIGTVYAGYKGAESERTESVRLASEDMSQALGKGTAAAQSFSDALTNAARQAGTPVAELAGTVRSLSRTVGTLTAGGIAAQAGLQSQLGDLYPEGANALGQFAAQHPYDASVRDAIRTGVGLPQSALGAALGAAASGNRDQAYNLLMVSGQANMSPAAQALQAQINAGKEANFHSGNPVFDWIRSLPGSKANRYVDALQKQYGGMPDARKFVVAPGQDKVLVDMLVDTLPQSTFLAQLFGTQSDIYASYGQQQVASGMGAPGLAPNVQAQVASQLQVQQQIGASIASVDAAIARVGPTPELNAMKLSLNAQFAQSRGSVIQARSGLFWEGVSNTAAGLTGAGQRMDVRHAGILLSGGSAFSGTYGMNMAAQASNAMQQAEFERATANSGEFVSPERREALLSSAAQHELEARFAIPNAWAVARIGETVSGSGVRQAGLSVGVAAAGVTGGVSETLRAQNELLREQQSLRDQLNQRLREGNLTLEQSRQVQSQILDLDRQQIEGRRQAIESAFAGHGAVFEAGANSGYALTGRTERLRGTSAATFDAEGKAYGSSMQQVALLRLRRDTATNPDDRALYDAQYQQAAAETEQRGIDAASTFSMGPVFETQRTRLTHLLGRQSRSPFEPGSMLQTSSRLAQMDSKELQSIRAQEVRVHNAIWLTADQKNAAMLSLAGNEERVKDDYFEQQQSVNLGWLDRITTMSVNAPSFAPRFMPSPMNVASIAEARGLGPMSARVFGFSSRSSYDGAAAMGMLPSEVNSLAFGKRSGDWPGAMPNDPINMDGSGMNIGRINSGPVGQGLPPHMVQEFTDTIKMLTAAINKGITVTVHQINPTTGQQAATTQNSSGNYSSQAVQRGGAASPALGNPLGAR